MGREEHNILLKGLASASIYWLWHSSDFPLCGLIQHTMGKDIMEKGEISYYSLLDTGHPAVPLMPTVPTLSAFNIELLVAKSFS